MQFLRILTAPGDFSGAVGPGALTIFFSRSSVNSKRFYVMPRFQRSPFLILSA
jgi:hypothetical protein